MLVLKKEKDFGKFQNPQKEKEQWSANNITHSAFNNICDYLQDGDLLVLNNSKVLPARLLKDNVEILLLENLGNDIWECIGKKLKKGKIIDFGLIKAEVLEISPDGNTLVKFEYDGNFFDVLDRIGVMPLPPYITEKLQDNNRYQTVYAKDLGSAAAPTAGLHFTDEILEKIKAKGVKIAYVTLHVGLGTFRPVKIENIAEHKMHSEYYEIPLETLTSLENAKRVIAVGTTSARTLESYALTGKTTDRTSIFIYPPYEFKVVDALLTNFHLPESTLIMLVSAFAGYENTLNAYRVAVQEKYRFFSFGDCMFISM
ncbi:S-adenosylmethionine:tRNA ribosyltransferase-isomerase [Clostridia bacterium]|nr:S-adenosylmethionine:tRNA ribosyltransferase-isomerase [Clostridia bacterium]